MPKLHQSIRSNNLDELKKQLRVSDNVLQLVNGVDAHGGSPLFYAVKKPDINPRIVELLLHAGADISFTKEDLFLKESLLSIALKNAPLRVIELLHRYGADFHYRDGNGYNAVLDAVHSSEERLSVVQFLIGLGVDVNAVSTFKESALKCAYHYGKFEIVKELMRAGANESTLKWTPLIRATAIGTIAEVEEELGRTRKLGDRDFWGRTALHVALLRGDLAIAQLLVNAGANLRESANNDTAPLCLAVESRNVELVRWLVEEGCSVESTDFLGDTCLGIAAQHRDQAMVRTLLELDANPNAGKRFGKVIEKAEDQEMILILAEHGANLDDLNISGRRVLLGLENDEDALDQVSLDEYLANRYPREGMANPEEMANPFWDAGRMVQESISTTNRLLPAD